MTSTSHTTITTEGGAVVEGSVETNGNFIGRDQTNITVAKDGLLIIQQFSAEFMTELKEMVDLGSNGAANVKLLQHGKRLHTYLLDKQAERDGKSQSPFGINPTNEVAILVDINRRLLLDVAKYLDTHEIEATIVIVTNAPQYHDQITFLSVNNLAEWTEIVQEFNTAVGMIKRYIGSVKMHFFLSTPLPLAFGLGAAWGTVDEGMVYHYERGTYHPVMKIDRNLRQTQ